MEDPEGTINKLKDTIENLKVELEQMHNKNDEMKEHFHKKIAELTVHSDVTVLQKGVSCHLSRSRKENDGIIGS